MKKILMFILKILKYSYLAFLGIYLVFILLHRISIDTSILGYRVSSITDNTMSPKYKVEDIVLVKNTKFNKLKVKDDISYKGNCCGIEERIINHRITNIEKNDKNKLVITTKGINSPVEDPKVEEKQFIGKIVRKLPVISFMHHILVNQLGFFLIVFCPLVITIVIEILQTITEIKLEKKKDEEEVI